MGFELKRTRWSLVWACNMVKNRGCYSPHVEQLGMAKSVLATPKAASEVQQPSFERRCCRF